MKTSRFRSCAYALGVGLSLVPAASRLRAEFGLVRGSFHGSASASGSCFALSGSVGQAVAGTSTRSTSGFLLHSGFWNVLTLRSVVAPTEDVAEFQAGRSVKIPLASLVADDRSLLGYGLILEGWSNTTERGGSIARVGSWLVYQPPAGPPGDDEFRYVVSDGQAGSSHRAFGTVRLRFSVPGEPESAPNALRLRHTGAEIEILFIGVPYRTYRVQFTDDLLPPRVWSNLPGSTTAGTNGVFRQVDPTTTSPMRLYRAVSQP